MQQKKKTFNDSYWKWTKSTEKIWSLNSVVNRIFPFNSYDIIHDRRFNIQNRKEKTFLYKRKMRDSNIVTLFTSFHPLRKLFSLSLIGHTYELNLLHQKEICKRKKCFSFWKCINRVRSFDLVFLLFIQSSWNVHHVIKSIISNAYIRIHITYWLQILTNYRKIIELSCFFFFKKKIKLGFSTFA